jgi:hypothetical protein
MTVTEAGAHMRVRKRWLVVAVVFGALLSGCGSSTHAAPKPATVTATVSSTRATTVPPTVASTAPSVPASASAGLVVTGAGSTLTPPGAPTTKAISASQSPNCYALADAGFNDQGCVKITSLLGTAVAIVEVQGSNERDLVYTVAAATAHLALRSTRVLPTSPNASGNYNPAATEVSSSDLANDNTTKAVFYAPISSSSGTNSAFTSVDVVEGDGKVVLHRNLAGGVARKAFGGGLETWTPAAASQATHDTFQYRQGAWRLTASAAVSSDAIPDSTGSF